MEKVWNNKSVDDLKEEEKDYIINMVFRACKDNEMMSDIGDEIFDNLYHKNFIWTEKIEWED